MKSVAFKGWELYPGRWIEIVKSDRKSGNPYRIFKCRTHRSEWIVSEWVTTRYGGYWSTLADFAAWSTAMLYIDRRIRYQYGNRKVT